MQSSGETTVNGQAGAGDESGLGTGEVGNHADDLFSLGVTGRGIKPFGERLACFFKQEKTEITEKLLCFLRYLLFTGQSKSNKTTCDGLVALSPRGPDLTLTA